MTLRLRDSQEGKVYADDFGTWYLVLQCCLQHSAATAAIRSTGR
jgi:hypothetical protein